MKLLSSSKFIFVFVTGIMFISLAGCSNSDDGKRFVLIPGAGNTIVEYPIFYDVFTTVEQQILPIELPASTPEINPRDVPLYEVFGYSAWQIGDGLPYEKRTDLAPDYVDAPNVSRFLSFFTMSDIHISDKESPAQVNWVGWSAEFGQQMSSAYSPVILSTTHVLDAAVQTINALHENTPFDFGISLGDTINNAQYNELRWYIDVLDGKVITPSSGAHLGADTIDYQKRYRAAGLDKSILWYQVLGNHDQFLMGSYYEFAKSLSAHIGTFILNADEVAGDQPTYAGIHGTGYYMGVVDGSTPYGDIIGAGPEDLFSTPPTVAADAKRHSLVSDSSTSRNWIAEFFKTTTKPDGHGFNLVDPARKAIDPGFACYSFEPKSDIPIKIIVLDDTCKGSVDDETTAYAAGCLDDERKNWLRAELQDGQDHDKLMIIAAHIPIRPQKTLLDPTITSLSHLDDVTMLAELHTYPNLILWISGHRHMNVVTPQPYDPNPLLDPIQGPANSFWEVETSSLRDFPQQFRTFDIRRNSDNTISIIITNVDPAVSGDSPAAKSRGYAVGSARVFGNYDISDTASQSYNAELVQQLTLDMQGIVAVTPGSDL